MEPALHTNRYGDTAINVYGFLYPASKEPCQGSIVIVNVFKLFMLQSGKQKVRKLGSKGNKENKLGPKVKVPKQPTSTSTASSSSSSLSSAAVVEPHSSSSSAPSPRVSAVQAADSITCDECNATFHELANFQVGCFQDKQTGSAKYSQEWLLQPQSNLS
jgi:hypothetical protein